MRPRSRSPILIGRELASKRAGLIAAAIVAVNPMLIWYSQEARSYAVLVFFGALALLFFVRALHSWMGRDLALWALASALALCSHYFAVFAVAIEAVWLLVAMRPMWRLVLPAVGAVVAVGLALLPLISAQVNPTHIGWIDHSALSLRLFETGVSFLAGETGHVIAEPPRERYALIPVVLIGVALLLVALRGSPREKRGALLGLVVGLGVVLLASAAALAGKDYIVERNLLPALVPLAIVVGAGFAAERGSSPGPGLRRHPLRLLARLRRLRHPHAQSAAPGFPRPRRATRAAAATARDRHLETRRRPDTVLSRRPLAPRLPRRAPGPGDRRGQQAGRGEKAGGTAAGLPSGRTS